MQPRVSPSLPLPTWESRDLPDRSADQTLLTATAAIYGASVGGDVRSVNRRSLGGCMVKETSNASRRVGSPHCMAR